MRRPIAELANSSAEPPAECRSTDAADNGELDHVASDDDASPHLTIFNDAELANDSAEQPAECRSSDAADNSKLDHFASHDHASPHFTIFDDADHRTEYKPDEWDSMLDDWVRALKHAPAALDGMVWHRYRDPDINQDWLSCATQPELWLYVHELRHLDDKGYFSFQGQWQLVVTPPPTETAAASSTVVTQPDTTDSSGAASCTREGTICNEWEAYGHPQPCPGSGVSTQDISSAVQPASDSADTQTASVSCSLSNAEPSDVKEDEAAAYWKTRSPHANQQTMKWKT